jgi:DNA-binding Xre family transcriptional regulator
MGKRLEVSDMPPLTVEMHDDLRHLEIMLQRMLNSCCSSHELRDKHAAFEYTRTYATKFYDCYYSFYSKIPDQKYQPHWRPASQTFAFDRIVMCIENNSLVAAYFRSDTTRVERIKRTISDHAERNEIPVALPAALTGKQASAYARAGIDIASASPLMIMAAMAARDAHLQPVSSPKQSRSSAQVDCRLAAAFIHQYINSKAMSLTDLATKAQTTDRTLRRLRKDGKIRRDILKRLADTMGVSVEKLIG